MKTKSVIQLAEQILKLNPTSGELGEGRCRQLQELATEVLNSLSSPCLTMGYHVGDKFMVIEDVSGFHVGQIVELYMDDGTNSPLFKGENAMFANCDGQEGAYLPLRLVKKIS